MAEITYDGIRAMIETFRTTDHDIYKINDKTAEAAINFTDVLEFAGARVPQIFTHGGDALVFTWHEGRKAAYITVTDDAVRQAFIKE